MRGGSPNALFGFVIGALVIVVVGLVWYVVTDGDPLNQRNEVTIELPSFD